MGQSWEANNDFTIGAKSVFDWVPNSLILDLHPYSTKGVPMCREACGPYLLLATDGGTLATGNTDAYAALKLSIGGSIGSDLHRYFYIEHRSELAQLGNSGGPGALIYWADARPFKGASGDIGQFVFTSCSDSPDKKWTNAPCNLGQSVTINLRNHLFTVS